MDTGLQQADRESVTIALVADARTAAPLSHWLADKASISVVEPAGAMERVPHLRADLAVVEAGAHGEGLALCRSLAGDADTAGMPVLVVAADEAQALAAMQAGAADVLTLPLHAVFARARVETQLALLQQRHALLRRAGSDGLTGLLSRSRFDELLEQEFQRHRRQSLPLGLALLDIDAFTHYNTAFGHAAGDAALRRIGAAVRSAGRRPAEAVARYEGDCFALLLPGSGRGTLDRFGQWLFGQVRALALPHPGSPLSAFVTVSAGLASHVPRQNESSAVLLQAVRTALAQAREAGGNRYAIAAVGPEPGTPPALRLV